MLRHAHVEVPQLAHCAIAIDSEHSAKRGSSQAGGGGALSANTCAAVNVKTPAATTATSDG